MNGASRRTRLAWLALALGTPLALEVGDATAGAFLFAGESVSLDAIAHPPGYVGQGGPLRVTVCIDPASANAVDMVAPTQNALRTLNALAPTVGNVLTGTANDVPTNAFDYESTAIHEIGHCLGLAHNNLAGESGLSGRDRDFTKSTEGLFGFALGRGIDGLPGSPDDQRGDDANLTYYNAANDPYALIEPVDATTYRRDLGGLPQGDSYPAIAERFVGLVYGLANSEAVMNQGQGRDEAQRTLAADDVSALRYGMSGLDEIAGTGDDYSLDLQFAGLTTACSIVLRFEADLGSVASCSPSGAFFLDATHVGIRSGSIRFNDDLLFYFNPLSNDGDLDEVPDHADNCAITPNAGQEDRGGIVSSLPDGTGDACQCGDVSGDGAVDGDDGATLRSALVANDAGVLSDPALCNVVGPADLGASGAGLPNDCDLVDLVVLRRTAAGAPPGPAQVCARATAPLP